MGHWELIIHLFTMTHSSTHGFHINLNDMLGSLSIQWLYLHDTNPASSMHCPLRPRAFIHPLHVPHSAQSNTQTPEEKGKIWVSGPLSYNKTRCVNLSWHSDPASLLQWPSSGVLVSLLNNTNYPTLCYLVPLALSFLATLLLCNQRYLRKMPICLCHTPASNLRSSSGQCGLHCQPLQTHAALSAHAACSPSFRQSTRCQKHAISLSTMSFFYYSTYWTWLSFDCKGFPDAKWISPIFSHVNKPL